MLKLTRQVEREEAVVFQLETEALNVRLSALLRVCVCERVRACHVLTVAVSTPFSDAPTESATQAC